MREYPLSLKSESELYQHLRMLTERYFYYERVEPANESGFPDIHFNTRPDVGLAHMEGTIELKYFTEKQSPNLNTAKFRGNQKAALLEYEKAGGRRRFVLAYHNGQLMAWNTTNAAKAILGRGHGQRAFLLSELDESDAASVQEFIRWLAEILT